MRDRGRGVRRTPPVRPSTLAAVVLVVTGLTAACTGSTDEPEEAAPSTDAVSDIDLTGVVASREAFCDALDVDAVAEVLGGEPTGSDGYDAGQRAELTTGLRDVSNEYSCYFDRGSDATLRTARAWLFAQQVTPAEARTWIEERERDDRCEAAGELQFGDPGLVQSCAQESRRRITAVGLFGDGWLSCQTTAPKSTDAEELLEQTQRWCAEVAQATAP